MLEGYGPGDRNFGVVSSTLIIEKEEQFVFSAVEYRAAFAKMRKRQWSAQTSAELVSFQSRSSNSTSVVKERIGGEPRSPIVFTQRAMVIVRAASGNHFDLPAAAAALVGARIGCSRPEFLYGFDRQVANRNERLASSYIVGINAVDRDVRLVRTCTSN